MGLAYLVVAWLIAQVVDLVLPTFDAPSWVAQTIILLLILGLPIVLIVAWAFEITPDGIKRTSIVPESESITPQTGQRLNYAIIAALAFAVVFLVIDNYVLSDSNEPTASSNTTSTDAAGEEQGVLPSSIAVLPFANLSPNAEDAYFAAGIHDEILNQLGKLRNLSVISRTSVLRYQDTNLSIPEIARELNVSTIMEGTVRYSGDRVRVTTQLVDARTDGHLRTETYERAFENIFAIESDIAMNVANALRAEFSLEDQERIERVPPQSSEADALFLEARAQPTPFGALDLFSTS